MYILNYVFPSPGYLPFLEMLQSQLEQLKLAWPSPTTAKPATPGTALPITEADHDLPVFGPQQPPGTTVEGERRDTAHTAGDGGSSCIIS